VAGRGEKQASERRQVVYCVIPRELAARLHEPLRKHFAAGGSVEVVSEERTRDRREPSERRADALAVPDERRRIRSGQGRRVADRRGTAVPTSPPPESLPRKARPFAGRLAFVEVLVPSTEQLEDRDTARLVSRIQSGAQDAFADLYMRYFDRVYGYLRVALNDPDAAEDGTQQVFMKAFEAIGRYDRGKAPFRAWLFTIVRNQAIDELRKSSRLELVEDVDRRSSRDRGAEDISALEWVSDRDLLMLIERLPLAQRQVLMLRYMLDLTTREIATVLDRSPEDIRSLQSRALAFIRARLTALGRAPSRQRSRLVRCPRQAPVLRRRRFALVD
jgi:RNA polymerase sigma-70 factor (ECF subfamily)